MLKSVNRYLSAYGDTPLPGLRKEVTCFQQVRAAILVQLSGGEGLDRRVLSHKELAATRRQQRSRKTEDRKQ